jgi:hypothetical protein
VEKRGESGMIKPSILFYTFRTNTFKGELKESFPDLFVFGKLNEDFVEFRKRVIEDKPGLIIGCAKSDRSCFEIKAINKFNSGNIIREGKDKFDLFVPSFGLFRKSLMPTTSFCNWTMYKISDLIEEQRLDSKLSFIHFKEEDYPKLIRLIEDLK